MIDDAMVFEAVFSPEYVYHSASDRELGPDLFDDGCQPQIRTLYVSLGWDPWKLTWKLIHELLHFQLYWTAYDAVMKEEPGLRSKDDQEEEADAAGEAATKDDDGTRDGGQKGAVAAENEVRAEVGVDLRKGDHDSPPGQAPRARPPVR
jgi:hypothetical protein